MRKIHRLLGVALFLLSWSSSAQSYPSGVYVMWPATKPIDTAVLKNPGVVGIYLQISWRSIEPYDNVFDWTNIDARLREAEQAELPVVFSIRFNLSKAPQWLEKNYYIQTIGLIDTSPQHETYCQKVSVPVFWDPVLNVKREHFIERLGQRYAHRKSIVAVTTAFAAWQTDDWGVPHFVGELNCNGKIRKINQVQTWLDAGWSTERMFKVGKQIIRAAANAFPHQSLKLPIHPDALGLDPSATYLPHEIADWAAATFPGRFFIQMDTVTAQTPAFSSPSVQNSQANDNAFILSMIGQAAPFSGLQMNWAASGKDVQDLAMCRQGHIGTSPTNCPPAEILQQSFSVANSYGVKFVEVWWEDALNPTAALFPQETKALGGSLRALKSF